MNETKLTDLLTRVADDDAVDETTAWDAISAGIRADAGRHRRARWALGVGGILAAGTAAAVLLVLAGTNDDPQAVDTVPPVTEVPVTTTTAPPATTTTPPPATTTAPPAAPTAGLTDHEAVVAFVEAWRNNDRDAMAAVADPDVVEGALTYSDPVGPTECMTQSSGQFDCEVEVAGNKLLYLLVGEPGAVEGRVWWLGQVHE